MCSLQILLKLKRGLCLRAVFLVLEMARSTWANSLTCCGLSFLICTWGQERLDEGRDAQRPAWCLVGSGVPGDRGIFLLQGGCSALWEAEHGQPAQTRGNTWLQAWTDCSARETRPALTCWEQQALLWCQLPARLSPAPCTEHTVSKCQSTATNPSGPPTTGVSLNISHPPSLATDRPRTSTQSPLNHSQTPLTSHTNYQLLTVSPVWRQNTLFFLDKNWLVILQKDP